MNEYAMVLVFRENSIIGKLAIISQDSSRLNSSSCITQDSVDVDAFAPPSESTRASSCQLTDNIWTGDIF